MRVAWVSIDLYGRFECSPNETHTAFGVLVQQQVIDTMDFQPNMSRCGGCLGCGYLAQVSSQYFGKAGLPDYDYGPRAPNTLSLRLDSGLVVLNGADIHIYAQDSPGDSGGGSTIDMADWEFVAILMTTLVGVVIVVSIICFGILLFLKWRERVRRRAYKHLSPGGRGDGGRKPSGEETGASTSSGTQYSSYYDDIDDSYDYSYDEPGRGRDIVINVGGEAGTGAPTRSTESTALLSDARAGGNCPAKAKDVRGDRGPHAQQQRPRHPGELARSRGKRGHTWMKQIQVTEIKILGRIGRGSYGDVFKGVWQGTVVAVKKLPGYFSELQEEESVGFLDNFHKEASIMRTLHHPNILQLLSTYMEPPDLCLVMEYMPKGSLYKILHDPSVQLDWPVIRKILLDAAKGMAYLHGCEPIVIHRDLKSHNLLIDNNWTCKVCDFGLSKIMTGRPTASQMTSCGTPSWTAPEVLRNERYSEKADIFGFGVILWECITREDPHAGMPPFQVVLEVGSKHLRPDIPKTAPKALQDLIEACWAEDPAQRPSFTDIVNILLNMNVRMLYPVAGDENGDENGALGHEEGEDEEPVRPVVINSPSAELRAPTSRLNSVVGAEHTPPAEPDPPMAGRPVASPSGLQPSA